MTIWDKDLVLIDELNRAVTGAGPQCEIPFHIAVLYPARFIRYPYARLRRGREFLEVFVMHRPFGATVLLLAAALGSSWAGALALGGIIVSVAQNDEESSLKSLKPEDILTKLDLSKPRLEAAKAGAERGDRTAALAALLAYYRQQYPRPEPSDKGRRNTKRNRYGSSRRPGRTHAQRSRIGQAFLKERLREAKAVRRVYEKSKEN